MLLDKETFTAISAGIAALGAIVTLIRSFIVPPDKIIVGFGSPSHNYETGAFMDVQNLSTHAIYIRDLGFIKDDWGQLSLPDHVAACNHMDERSHEGKLNLNQRELSHAWYGHKLNYLGAYAYTTTQKYPRIKFSSEVGIFKSLRIRLFIYRRFFVGISYWGAKP